MATLLEDITTVAKQNLQRDGRILPVFFLIKGEQLVVEPKPTVIIDEMFPPEQLSAEESKSRAVFVMGVLARQVQADRIIMIWDAAFRSYEKGTDFDPLNAPLTYPKSMRTECIILNDIQLQTGKDATVIVPYKGGDGEPVEFLPNTFDGMECESRFTELAIRGYNKAVSNG